MRLIKLKEVISITGLGRSSIYKFMAEGHFPMSISLGERAVAWELGEIEEWVQLRIDNRKDITIDTSKKVIPNITETDVIMFIRDKFQQLTIADSIAWLIQISK